MAFYLNEFIVSLLDRAVDASLGAERGPFYDTMMALCAFAAFDLGRQGANPETVPDDKVLRELITAYRKQMAQNTRKEFNLKSELQSAKDHFDNPHALLPHLERQAAAFRTAFHDWQAAGAPQPEVTLKQKLLGPMPGDKDDLLAFARTALSFATSVFDSDSEYESLGRPLEILMDDLPA